MDAEQYIKETLDFCRDLVQDTGEAAELCEKLEAAIGQQKFQDSIMDATELLGIVMHCLSEMSISTGMASFAPAKAKTVTKLAEAGKDLSEGRDGERGPSVAQLIIADVHVATQNTKKATKAAKKALDAFKGSSDQKGEAASLQTMSNIHILNAFLAGTGNMQYSTMKEVFEKQAKKNMDDALSLAKDAVELYRTQGDRKHEAAAMNKVADVHLLRKEPEQAMEITKEAQMIFQEEGDKRGEASVLHTLLAAHMEKEDKEEALKTAEEVSEIFDDSEPKGKAEMLLTLAQVHNEKDDPDKCLTAAKKALGLAKQINDDKLQARAYELIFSVQTDFGIMEVFKTGEDFVALARKCGDKEMLALALHILGKVRCEKQIKDMQDLRKQKLEEAHKKGEPKWTAVIEDPNGTMLKDMESATKLLTDSIEIYKELGDKEGEEQVVCTAKHQFNKLAVLHCTIIEPDKTYVTEEGEVQVYELDMEKLAKEVKEKKDKKK